MKVFNLCAKVTKRHLVSLGVYLGIFAVLAVMLTAFNNTSQSLSFEAVRPSAAIVNRDGESALVRGLEDFLAGYADMVKLEDDRLIRNGNPFGKEDIAEVTGERPAEGTELELTCVRVYNSDGEFCGLYRREQGGRRYKPEKMFLS